MKFPPDSASGELPEPADQRLCRVVAQGCEYEGLFPGVTVGIQLLNRQREPPAVCALREVREISAV